MEVVVASEVGRCLVDKTPVAGGCKRSRSIVETVEVEVDVPFLVVTSSSDHLGW